MRTWFITFLVSTVASVALWQFGLAHMIWAAHPFVATIGIAVACGIATQVLLPKITSPRI
jgi:predicted exporter